ncbi:unnamed protein product, partial [Polarella glacialis]
MKELVVEVEMAPDGTPRLEAALGRLSRHAAGDLEAVRLHFKDGQNSDDDDNFDDNNNIKNNDSNSNSNSSNSSSSRHPRVDDQRMSEVVEHVKLALLLATATASCFRSVIISGCPSPTLLVVMLEAIKHNAVLQSCTLDLGDTSISDQTGLAL